MNPDMDVSFFKSKWISLYGRGSQEEVLLLLKQILNDECVTRGFSNEENNGKFIILTRLQRTWYTFPVLHLRRSVSTVLTEYFSY